MGVSMLGLGAITTLLLNLGLPTRGDLPADEANPKELAKFDGSWEISSPAHEGKAAEGGTRPPVVCVFEGGRMAAVGRGPVGYGTIRVDPSKDPARIDWTYGDSPAKTATSD